MYHYRESGLRNIWLKNGYRTVATPYGKGISIAGVDDLHRAIAKNLIEHEPLLSGAEFRFLRKELGLSQGKIADVLGTTEQTVSLWERKGRAPKWADRFLRALYREHTEGNAHIRAMVETLNEIDRRQSRAKLMFTETPRGWRTA